MKILTIPKTLLFGLILFFVDIQASNSPSISQDSTNINTEVKTEAVVLSTAENTAAISSALSAEVPSDAVLKVKTDYSPFAAEHGCDLADIAETCAYFEEFLSKDRLEQARIEALCGRKKTEIFDWNEKFWNGTRWLLGTSRNLASITVVGVAIFANVFPEKAVTLATVAGIVEGFGALLYKMHKYCKDRKMERIGYNLVVMNGQAAVRRNTNKTQLQHENEMTEMEEGRAINESSSNSSSSSSSQPSY